MSPTRPFPAYSTMQEIPTISGSRYPEILCFGDSTLALADKVYGAYLEILISTFLDALQNQSPKCLESFRTLPEVNQRRIIEAPDTYNQLTRLLRNEKNVFLEYIHETIEFEFARSKRPYFGSAAWACDGGLLLDQSERPVFDDTGWRIGGYYEAPKVGGHIPIDHHSPFARRPMPVASFRSVQYGNALAFNPEEEKIANRKILESFQVIKEAMPTAANFVTNYAKTIIARKGLKSNKIFQSASRNAFIGQIVLLNAHAPHVDREYIAESLIHESIHSLLWRAEILEHFLIRPSEPIKTVISNWSGEEIYYYTLLQACFVWFGIFWFWRGMSASSARFSLERMKQLEQRARAGFVTDGYEDALSIHKNNLRPGVWNVFIELKRMVQDAR